jgi:PAS domain S-box-containing protein
VSGASAPLREPGSGIKSAPALAPKPAAGLPEGCSGRNLTTMGRESMHRTPASLPGALQPPATTLGSTATHVVQFYDGEDFLADVVAEFMAAGIASGQSVVVFATEPHLAAFTTRLAAQGFGLAELCRSGRLTLRDARETLATFMSGSTPDPQLFQEAMRPVIEKAVASANHSVVRAYGELVDVLWKDGQPLAAIRLEELWNELAQQHSFSLLCAYAMGHFYKEAHSGHFDEICQRHGDVLPTEEYSRLDAPARALEVARLQQRARTLENEIRHRRELEDSLREALADARCAERSSLQLAAIVESSEDAIVSKDLDGIVTSWNQAAERMFGYEAAEMVGQSIRRLIPADRQAEEDDVLARVRRGETINHYETVRHRKDGSRIHISLTVSPIRDRSGRIVGASKIARDISERKQLEAEREELLAREHAARTEAEEVNRVKDEFLAVLSHELRTPLNAILGWTQVVKGWRTDPATVRRALEVIDRNARAQAHLVDDLLDVSRIVSGKLQMTFERIDLARVLSAAVDSIRPAAREKGVQLDAVPGQGGHWVIGDADRLQQVIGNVLSNAVKFTPSGGRVDARFERDGAEARIVVSDTGQGIPAEFLPHVFDRFRQADGSAAREHGGLGLGLSVARHIVEAHGGTITAASRGEALGSTFTIVFPPSTAASEVVQPDPARGAADRDLRGVRLLVVDDEPDGRRLLQFVLQMAGATVDTAASTAEALQAVTATSFDAVLTDLGMPGRDGFDLILALRSHALPHLRTIAAVAVTAYATDQSRRRALASGYDAYVTKPVNDGEIVRTIVGLLASRNSVSPVRSTEALPDNAGEAHL